LVGGLPGSGKSTLARALAEHAGFAVLRADVIRKELAGLDAHALGSADLEQGIYAPEWTERTYAECLRRAEALLAEGKRVVVDAGFRRQRQRELFLQAARRCALPGLFLECRAEPATVRARLTNRRGDASDADWTVYEHLAKEWEAVPPATPRFHW